MNKRIIIIAISAITVLALVIGAIYFLRTRDIETTDNSQSSETESPSVQEPVDTVINPTNPVTGTSTNSEPSEGFNFEGNVVVTEANIDEINALLAAEALKPTSTTLIPDELVSSTDVTQPDSALDTDSDSIPDTEESRYGTDPLKSDTDGDGFTDADEIKNGYNPLGQGRCAVSTCIIN